MRKLIGIAPLAFGVLSLGLFAANCCAADFLIIVDSSGSMSERTKEGESRMEAAKDALWALKADMAAHQIGMTVFGHRIDPKMAGSCTDVETVLPISSFNEAEYDRVIRGLRPRGNTPLASALKQAATELMFREKTTSKIVIVVTDGNETCGGDPIAVAQQMQTLGINVTVHVIGFGVKPEEQLQLQKLAKAGNGQFGLANTKSDLQKILQKQITQADSGSTPPKVKTKLSVIEKALVSRLQDDHRDVRTSTAKALLKMKSLNAVPFLCERMKIDEDHYAWSAASSAVLALNPAEYRKTIIAAMKSKTLVVQIRAAESAIHAGDLSDADHLSGTDTALIEALKDAHRDVRTAAGKSLLTRKTVAAVPYLAARIPIDDDHYAWESAFAALRGLSKEKAAEALLTALDSDSATVRTRATERLSTFAATD